MADENIKEILRSIERYNPGNLDLLIDYVRRTCEDGTYDIEAYLAVLKLYQFNPHKYDLETVKTILLKAITSLPNNDFTLCLYLLSEEQQQDPEIATLIELSNSLESCLFEDVWEFLREDKATLDAKVRVEQELEDDGEEKFEHVSVNIKGFVESIRKFIAHIVSTTYQVVDCAVVSTMLGNVNDVDLASYAESNGWKLDDAGKIFVGHQEDIVKSKNITESLQFESQ